MLLWPRVRIIIHAIYLVTSMPELSLHTEWCPGNHVLWARTCPLVGYVV